MNKIDHAFTLWLPLDMDSKELSQLMGNAGKVFLAYRQLKNATNPNIWEWLETIEEYVVNMDSYLEQLEFYEENLEDVNILY